MTGRLFGTAVEVAVTAFLVLTPLALGSVYGWTYRTVAATAFLLLALWAVKSGSRKGFSHVRTPLIYFLPLAAAFVILQSVNLPVSIVQAVSPGRAAMDAAAGLSSPREALSLYPWATLDIGVFVVALVIFFLAVLNLDRTGPLARRAVIIVVALGTLFALAALARSGGDGTRLHFLPYVNNNHFAGYLEVAISLAVASFVFGPSVRTREKRVKGFLNKALKLRWLTPKSLMGAAAAVMSAGLLLSGSRGGLMGLTASLLVIVMLGYRQGRNKAAIPFLVMLILVSGLSLTYMGKVSERLARLADVSGDSSAMLRMNIWKDTSEIVKGFPVAGVGLGGYETAYQYHKTVKKFTRIFQPESDYLYVLAEGGLVGAATAGAFLVLLAAALVSACKKTAGTPRAGVAAGALAALAALAVHGVVDTNLHIPANAFLMAVVAALGVAAGMGDEGRGGDGQGPKAFATVWLRGAGRRWAMYGLAALSLLVSAYAVSGAAADLMLMSAMQEKKAVSDGDPEDTRRLHLGYDGVIRKLARAGSLDPGRIDYPFETGMAYNALGRHAEALGSCKADDIGMLTSTEYFDLALKSFREAGRTNPYNSFTHLVAGRALEDGLGDRQRGEAEYLVAERLNPTNRLIKKYLIEYYDRIGDLEEAGRRRVELAEYDPANNYVTINSLAPDVQGGSAFVGDVVTWTAEAEIVVGAVEYKFCLKGPEDADVVEMTGYTGSNKWKWDTSASLPGRYHVVVRVRGVDGMAKEKGMAYPGGFTLKKGR